LVPVRPGYTVEIREDPAPPTGSSKPACSDALDELELFHPHQPGVDQARVNFTGPEPGESLQEIIRRYPARGAAPALSDVRSRLQSCGSFLLTYADEQRTLVRVVSAAAPSAGDESWAAQVVADTGAIQLQENLLLLRVAGSLIVLSDLTPATTPLPGVDRLARLAADKLRTTRSHACPSSSSRHIILG